MELQYCELNTLLSIAGTFKDVNLHAVHDMFLKFSECGWMPEYTMMDIMTTIENERYLMVREGCVINCLIRSNEPITETGYLEEVKRNCHIYP